LRAIAVALGARLDAILRWDGGELDRLVNGRHSAMHELVARRFSLLSDWVAIPEVTFAIYGDRGIVDVLAWHAASATVLVIELKTEIVDVQELIGTLDRKRRLARTIAKDRGWAARQVAAWLIVGESRTNRRRAAAHATVFRSAFPDPPRRVKAWMEEPTGSPLAAMTFLSDVHGSRIRSALATPKRVGRPRSRSTAPAAGAIREIRAPLTDRDESDRA
jgi:hypothetical protein